jgi:hypothetical protein
MAALYSTPIGVDPKSVTMPWQSMPDLVHVKHKKHVGRAVVGSRCTVAEAVCEHVVVQECALSVDRLCERVEP